MKNADFNLESVQAAMQQAMKDGDSAAFYNGLNTLVQHCTETRLAEMMDDMTRTRDAQVLAARGQRQLTGEEREYYTQIADAMKTRDVRQALANVSVTMPKTVISAVFEDLSQNHPLLSHVNFMPVTGVTEMLLNTNGAQQAQWGDLCEEIVKELESGFDMVNMTLCKLSAFLPVCKAMLDLGPEWLDSYVRSVLYEALANGLEYGCIDGTGNKMPIGMDRKVGAGVAVTEGVYPKKEAQAITDLSAQTVGALVGKIAVSPDGKPRTVRDLLLVVNPADYYTKVMPATTVMAPDGTYRSDVTPVPMTIVQSNAVAAGEAVFGLGYKYFAGVGMNREGRIEFDDSYKFLQDQRVYAIKLYANGFPMDNNAFIRLDISGLKPLTYKVEMASQAGA